MSDTAPHHAEPHAAALAHQTAPTDAQAPASDVADRTDRPAPRGGRRGAGRPGGPRQGARGGAKRAQEPKLPKGPSHPVLTQLAELEPTLFGDKPLPLKRGIFHDLMAAHPGVFEKEALKTALGLHTRSTRYLVVMASGQQRHDLQGQPVEVVAPEHRYHALLESFRRRHARTGEDVRQKVYAHILKAAEESALSPTDYAALVRSKDEAANEILDAAMAELDSRLARDEALLRAFTASGQSVNDFADAYGLHPIEAGATLARAKARADAAANAAPPTTEATPPDAAEPSPDEEPDAI